MTTLQCLPLAPEPVTDDDLPGTGVLRAGTRVLPMRAVEVEADVVGLAATTYLRQRFSNPTGTALEVTYVFPLPGRSAVTAFTATLGGRRITGRLKERAAAREAYDLAVAAGQRAAIAEEDRPEVFSTRVGNLMPGEDAVVELELTGPVAVEGGEATYRFPLVVAERYTAGRALPGEQAGAGVAEDTDAVPDASRVTPPRYAAGDDRPDLDIVVRLDGAGLRVENLRSTLHAGSLDVAENGTLRLRLTAGQQLDRDLIVRWDVAGDRLGTSAVLVQDEGEETAGTWSVTVVPPVGPAAGTRPPRDVVVLLDRSGSMGGWKIVAARRAAARIVDALDRDDRFLVLGFDHMIEYMRGRPGTLAPATDRNRFAAVGWLSTLEARGGTEMAEPLRQGASLLAASPADAPGAPGAPRERTLVLVTDGQISGEDHVLAAITPMLSGTRVFAVGIDRAVNAGFLDRLANAGRGRWELVESENRLDDVLSRITRSVTAPVLTDVRVSGQGIEVDPASTTPRLAPDAHAGSPCVVSGRYRRRPEAGPTDVELHVTADPLDAGGPAIDLRVVPRQEPSPAVRAIWARARIRDLEDTYATAAFGAGMDELAQQIVDTSLRFGVLSRFTAFVAVDEEQTGAEYMAPVSQPVEEASGWASAGYAPQSFHVGGVSGPLHGVLGVAPPPPARAMGAMMPSPELARPAAPRAAFQLNRAPVTAQAQAESAGDAPALPPLPQGAPLPWLGALLAALAEAAAARDIQRLLRLNPHLQHATRFLPPTSPGSAEVKAVAATVSLLLGGPGSGAAWQDLGRAVAAARSATEAPDVAPLDEGTTGKPTARRKFWKL